MEAPGGVRPEAADGHRVISESLRHEATSAGGKPAIAARERFEGEHPFVSWPPGRNGQAPNEGYAPSECRLKPWPIEAQSGAWRARIAGKRNEGFRFERVEAGRTLPAGVREASLTEPFARSGASTSSSLACARLRPLHEIARARGRSLLLTTHFSGADEAFAGTVTRRKCRLMPAPAHF